MAPCTNCTCSDISLLFFILNFYLHILYKHNSKAVNQFNNKLAYENYTANYKYFPGASIKFQEISSISRGYFKFRKFPAFLVLGVVESI